MSLFDVCDLTKDKILNAEEGKLGVYAVQIQRADNKVQGVVGSIGEAVHAKAHLFQREAIALHGMDEADENGVAAISAAANKAAHARFLAWYHNEERGARGEMTPDESTKGMAKAASSLDSAYRKLKAGLEHGCDLSEFTTTNKVQTWNRNYNIAEDERVKEKAHREWCVANNIDPDAKSGPQGAVSGGKDDAAGGTGASGAEGELNTPPSQMQVDCARLAAKLEELAALGHADDAADKLMGVYTRVCRQIEEIKGSIGDRIATG
jgi:hypothetical protein